MLCTYIIRKYSERITKYGKGSSQYNLNINRAQFSWISHSMVSSVRWCMIKIFRGGEGVVVGVGGSSERCLKWGGGGWGVTKESFQKFLKIGGE